MTGMQHTILAYALSAVILAAYGLSIWYAGRAAAARQSKRERQQ